MHAMTAAFDFSLCLFYLLLYFLLHRLKENDAKIFWVFDHKRNNLLQFLIHNAKIKGQNCSFQVIKIQNQFGRQVVNKEINRGDRG